MKHIIRSVLWFVGFVVAIVALQLIVSFFPIITFFSTSDGYWDGEIQKFSYSGIFRKSYEGDIATLGSSRDSGSIGNVRHFSVKDSNIAKQIQSLPPFTPVRLHYHSYLWTCNVDTNHIVYKIDVSKDSSLP